MRYNVSHDYISESVLNDIVKRPIEYILHRRQSDYDTDSDEYEEISQENSVEQQIDDISKEKQLVTI